MKARTLVEVAALLAAFACCVVIGVGWERGQGLMLAGGAVGALVAVGILAVAGPSR